MRSHMRSMACHARSIASPFLATRSFLVLSLVAATLAFANTAAADSITFSSLQAVHGVPPGQAIPGWTWNYSGNYADPRLPALHASFANHICVGPGGACGSNDNLPPAGNDYHGFEFIYFTFALPAGAAHIAVNFTDQNADDRHVLLVNQTLIGGFKPALGIGNSAVVTNMQDQAGLHTVNFSGTSAITLNDQSLFNVGADNFLAFWINNTNSSAINAPAREHCCSGDPSALHVGGTIAFDVVPEPGTLLLVGSSIAALAGLARRRCRGPHARTSSAL